MRTLAGPSAGARQLAPLRLAGIQGVTRTVGRLAPIQGVTRGPALVAARMGQVTASMRQVTKAVGDTLTIRVNWTPETRDAQGNLIPWPYRVRCQIRHAPWVIGRFETDKISSTVTTSSPIPTLFSFDAPDLEGVLEILAFVEARPSRQDGTPDTSTWDGVDEAKLENAYEIIAGAADPEASITSIQASQTRPRHRDLRLSEAGVRVQAGPPEAFLGPRL
ncbi:MAG: hypothetical protein WD533_06460 [Dehalococcoidia bacterium]